jgi:ribosomal protein S18 acetylase RimI-like enzyme
MKIKIISDKSVIYNFLSKNPALQIYLIGDLDDFFWPHTKWFAVIHDDSIKSVALLYSGENPTFLLYHDGDPAFPFFLINSVRKELPEQFNVHLSPGLINHFGTENIIKNYGHNLRMVLKKLPEVITDENIRRLLPEDIEAMKSLYELSYPENWFESRMVETGKYFGYFINGSLAGISGVHVYSKEYRVAALGNIATHPGYRGMKIAYKLTVALCEDLKNDTDTIGLNVKSGNIPAIRCYENAGFETYGSYDECLIRNA